MEVSGPAAAGTPIERPPWWPVIVGVFVGYLWALLTLGLVALALDLLGVVSWLRGPRGEGWLTGPFEPDGPWSLFADAIVSLTVLAATSGLVVWALSYRGHRRVSWSVAFLALTATGYAPYLFFEGRLRVSGVVGLLLSAALIRWFGIAGAQPADFLARLEDRLAVAGLARRRIAFVFAVCWAAALGAGVAYGLTHPLRITGGSGPSESARPIPGGGDTRYEILRGPAGATRSVLIVLGTNGFARIRDVRVEPGSEATLPIRRVAFGEGPFDPPATAPSTTTIPGRGERFLSLWSPIPRCARGFRTLSLIRVRYTVYGQEHSQLVRLDPPIAARCSRTRRP